MPAGRCLILLLAVAIVARAATFGNPNVHVDEDFYFTVARAMWGGAIPYLDIWDRKPVGLFLLYMPPAALPFRWGVWAYQAMALAAVVATAFLVVHMARRIAPDRGALLAGIAYILWLNLAGGQGGQAGVLHNLPMAGAAALILANERRRFAPDAMAMLLVGIALQIKYSVVFEGMFFGLWIMWRLHARGVAAARVAAQGAVLASIALLPTAAAAGYYAAIGQGAAFGYANFFSIAARKADPWTVRAGNLLHISLLLAPLIGMAVAGRGAAPARRFVLAWFAVSLGAIIVFGDWYLHYALPAFLPGTVAAAPFLGRVRKRWSAAILLLVAVAGEGVVIGNIAGRGTTAQFAASTDAIGHGRGCLYVYSGTPMLYASTGRPACSRWMFPGHLYLAHEAGAVGVDQLAEIDRILARGPDVITMRPPASGERAEARRRVMAVIGGHYWLVARLPMGDEIISVYRRRKG
ncbi:hypothetical protein [Sphingomonas sp. CL5.1]|uniref:hypothetical protein n=1 Tax=Sphingomonas sp. CL5.1 TaxID=2653203 RepID=UPI0020C6F9E0|nr:hypothetical protein [Sphingomonas sp. CL5.1]